MQIITITGNVGRDPESRTTQSGEAVCNLNVAVKQGYGDRATTNWFRCSVWGKRGEAVARYVRKGNKVTVLGEFILGDYQGKPQLEIRVSEIDWPANSDAPRDQSGNQSGGGNGFGDEDDGFNDDVPFASCAPHHDLMRHTRVF